MIKTPCWLSYIGDYITLFFGDYYKVSKQDPYETNSISWFIACRGFVVVDLAQVLPTFLLGVKKRSLESQRVRHTAESVCVCVCSFKGEGEERCFKSFVFFLQRCFLNKSSWVRR